MNSQIQQTVQTIDSLVDQMDELQDRIEVETDAHMLLLMQLFQGITAANIHLLNQNMLLMDTLHMYDTPPEEEPEEEETDEEKAHRQKVERFLHGNR